MTAATVVATTTNTRVNSADSNTNWGNWGSGGGAPASEAQLAYHGTAVNTQVKTTALDGIDYDPGSGAVDMTGSTRSLWIVKVIVGDSFDLNTTEGVRIGIGSANNAYYYYNVAGSGSPALTAVFDEYPAQGGYIITAVNPNNATFRTQSGGIPTVSGIDWFGVQCAMVVGAAKNENLAMDSIDVGIGLEIHAGTGADDPGVMQDFADADQGGTRWGYVTERSGLYTVHGQLHVGRNGGSAAVTEWDDASIVVFPDAFYDPGDCGFLFDLGNASTIIDVATTVLGRGVKSGSDDTRPDLTVTGTSGVFAMAGATITNHRNVTFTSACTINAASRIECDDLTQGTADIEGATTIVTTAATNVATCDDATFGTATGFNNMTFEQGGAGHALSFDDAIGQSSYQAEGSGTSGIGDISPAWPTHAVDDVALLVVESDPNDSAPTLGTPAGFTLVAHSATSTTPGTATRISVWWHRATSTSMAAPTVTDPGDHLTGRIITYRGLHDTGNPYLDVVAVSQDTEDTAIGFSSGTGYGKFAQRVVLAVSHGIDTSSPTQVSALAASNVTGETERSESATSSGNGGGFAVADGTYNGTTQDADVTWTGTLASSTAKAGLIIFLREPESERTLTNIDFTGYGIDGAADAAIDITDTTGSYVFNISGGDTPTVKSDGAGYRFVASTDLTLTGLVNPTEVRVYDAGTQTEIAGTENATTGSVTYSLNSANYTDVDIRIHAVQYIPQFLESVDMTGGDVTIPIVQIFDRVYNNP